MIANMSMQRYDTDSDGKLSSEEIGAIDSQWSAGIKSADTDGDGAVSRAELLQSIKKRFQGAGN